MSDEIEAGKVTLKILRRYYEIAQARGRENGETVMEDIEDAMRQLAEEAKKARGERDGSDS